MITTELELMQASADAELEAQEALQKFMVEWVGKRGKPKPQPPAQAQIAPPMPPQGQQVMYG